MHNNASTASPIAPPIASPSSSTGPLHYAADVQVSQVGEGVSVLGFLGFALVFMVPGILLAVRMDPDATGWAATVSTIGMLGGVALSMVGAIVGMVLWLWLEQRLLRRGGKALFSATTPVRLDAEGLYVHGLGVCGWQDVLSCEGVPDSDNALIVHTRPFGRLLLQTRVEPLLEVLGHYLEAARTDALREAHEGAHAVLRFKGLVFHWPRFLAWIAAGYLLAGAVGLLLLGNADHAGGLKTLVGLVVLLPLSAWLVWTIPFWQFSLFAPKRTLAFELSGATLRSTDDAWRLDLRAHPVRLRSVSGIGYKFDFFSLRTEQGKRLDLMLDLPEQAALLEALRRLGVLA